jgi:hypothetical protein
MRTICRPPRAVMVSVGSCCAPDVTCRPGRSPCQGFHGLSCLGGWCRGRASALSESCWDPPHLTIHQHGTRRLGLYQRRVELCCAGRYLTLTPMPRRVCAGRGLGVIDHPDRRDPPSTLTGLCCVLSYQPEILTGTWHFETPIGPANPRIMLPHMPFRHQ